MSRIGKSPFDLPKGVQMTVENGELVCKGPKGTLRQKLADGVAVAVVNGNVSLSRNQDDAHTRAMHGTLRAIAKNMAIGVTQGYSRKLEIVGVGYKAVLQGKKLNLSVGFANIITVDVPAAIEIKLSDANHVEVIGIDKQLVGQVAADIRAARKPEPYKGKGVRYADELVRRKAGKAAAAGASGKK